ncbi:hypothetical protein B0G77_5207 [Paraburkholderia sp. BL10I2N1]|nr:hypothetical protein B0G77_5207 [Paraburkholderia sp. BL10I2N1]
MRCHVRIDASPLGIDNQPLLLHRRVVVTRVSYDSGVLVQSMFPESLEEFRSGQTVVAREQHAVVGLLTVGEMFKHRRERGVPGGEGYRVREDRVKAGIRQYAPVSGRVQ